jgi:hypothetical protein
LADRHFQDVVVLDQGFDEGSAFVGVEDFEVVNALSLDPPMNSVRFGVPEIEDAL